MSPPGEERAVRRSIWQRWWPWGTLFGLYLGVMCVVVVIRAESTSDFRDFWENAKHFRETGQISAELGVHNYLPFFTIFMLPVSFVPLPVAIVAFTLLSGGLFVVTVLLTQALLWGEWRDGPRGSILLAVALVFPYLHSGLALGTVGALLLFLIVAAWFVFDRGDEWFAGLPLGLAALIKILPGLLILFFLVKGKWRVGLSAGLVALGLGFGLPLLSLGWSETWRQHATLVERAGGAESARNTLLADRPSKAIFNNNALPIVLRRTLTPLNSKPDQQGSQLYVNVLSLPREVVWWLYVGIVAALIAGSLAVSLGAGPGRQGAAPHALAAWNVQFGMWCCLMLLLSPLVWTHYLVLAFWPLAVLTTRLELTVAINKRPCRLAIAALAVWLLGASLLISESARAAGAQLMGVFAVWVVLALLARYHERADRIGLIRP